MHVSVIQHTHRYAASFPAATTGVMCVHILTYAADGVQFHHCCVWTQQWCPWTSLLQSLGSLFHVISEHSAETMSCPMQSTAAQRLLFERLMGLATPHNSTKATAAATAVVAIPATTSVKRGGLTRAESRAACRSTRNANAAAAIGAVSAAGAATGSAAAAAVPSVVPPVRRGWLRRRRAASELPSLTALPFQALKKSPGAASHSLMAQGSSGLSRTSGSPTSFSSSSTSNTSSDDSADELDGDAVHKISSQHADFDRSSAHTGDTAASEFGSTAFGRSVTQPDSANKETVPMWLQLMRDLAITYMSACKDIARQALDPVNPAGDILHVAAQHGHGVVMVAKPTPANHAVAVANIVSMDPTSEGITFEKVVPVSLDVGLTGVTVHMGGEHTSCSVLVDTANVHLHRVFLRCCIACGPMLYHAITNMHYVLKRCQKADIVSHAPYSWLCVHKHIASFHWLLQQAQCELYEEHHMF